jgi:hypothetical protein
VKAASNGPYPSGYLPQNLGDPIFLVLTYEGCALQLIESEFGSLCAKDGKEGLLKEAPSRGMMVGPIMHVVRETEMQPSHTLGPSVVLTASRACRKRIQSENTPRSNKAQVEGPAISIPPLASAGGGLLSRRDAGRGIAGPSPHGLPDAGTPLALGGAVPLALGRPFAATPRLPACGADRQMQASRTLAPRAARLAATSQSASAPRANPRTLARCLRDMLRRRPDGRTDKHTD